MSSQHAPEHRAVDGGFECECGTTRQTPLGIARHRAICQRGESGDAARDQNGDPILKERDSE